jgi:D-ribose pyranose/furanose isomerase RbsD
MANVGVVVEWCVGDAQGPHPPQAAILRLDRGIHGRFAQVSAAGEHLRGPWIVRLNRTMANVSVVVEWCVGDAQGPHPPQAAILRLDRGIHGGLPKFQRLANICVALGLSG